MNSLGVHLQLLLGRAAPVPAPPVLLNALQNTEITHSEQGRSGFQLSFQGSTNLLSSPFLAVHNRIVLTAIFNSRPHTLIDGFITHQQLQPDSVPGTARATITGEDISVLMDREQRRVEHPGQEDHVIARKLILRYSQYGLSADVRPTPLRDIPNPNERTPVQLVSDLAYIQMLAERHAFVFFVTPGPASLTSCAYWGPPRRSGMPQRALSVNMGPHSNVDNIDFQHNALATEIVTARVQDAKTARVQRVRAGETKRPALASQSSPPPDQKQIRVASYSGLSATQAQARAQAEMERSRENAVTASGELDTLRYGGVLRARELVGVRGAGLQFDGLYSVREVTHILQSGTYRQRFSLAREGQGSTVQRVAV